MDLDKLNTTTIFPTNILTYTWPKVDKLNKQFIKMILAESKKSEGLKVSNAGGYHSPNDLLSWDYPCVKTLITMIQPMAQVMAQNDGLTTGNDISLSLAAWSNIIENGHYHALHRHPNNFWSGVYYIADGDPDETVETNGYFEFVDPRPAANLITSDSLKYPRYQINPSSGLMVMFPSYVDHYVHPYIGDKKRITIAFNVRVV